MSDERKVYTEVDGVVYRGRRSVHMSGRRVWIDGQEVGIEVDNNGEPLATLLPRVEVDNNGEPLATLLPRVEMNSSQKKPWWPRLLRLLGWRSK